jgi:thiamine biosynthesis lipoprotein
MDTDGAFDATISPIVRLWGIGTEDARVPTREEIASALLSVGYQDIALDRGASAVTLGKKGMRLDLGGIAKGHACDEAVGILKNAGVSHAIIDLGGNIYAYGTRPDGSPWRVGVKSPLLGENEYFAIVTASEQAVVTSGVYERFLESGGALYHHIMDPRTGYPVDNGLLSVTIVSGSSTQADALSTACFVLGAERGIEYLSGLPGVEGIFVSDDLSVKVTDGLKGSFTVKDGRFRLVGSDEEG